MSRTVGKVKSRSDRSLKTNSKKVAKAPAKASKAPKTKKIAKKVVAKAPTKAATVRKIKAAKQPAKTARAAPRVVRPVKTPSAAPIRAKKVAKSTPSILGYTPAQYEKYKQERKKLNGWSNQKLKDALKANLQSMSGNKDELVDKVADGIVLGRIPRCPACFGGRPAFDFKKGTYNCKGYRDDTDFVNCHKTFTLAEIKRDPWTS